MSAPNSKRNSVYLKDKDKFEQDSGRATRARTRLIVEGFSNLALIATFFAGVQAQLISVTNSNSGPGSAPPGPVSVATNAAFYGGLIFSIFTAVLATLSARWFSILREDDADYLSSRWLRVDSKMKDKRLLQDYLDYQIVEIRKIVNETGPIQGTPNRPNSQQSGHEAQDAINESSARQPEHEISEHEKSEGDSPVVQTTPTARTIPAAQAGITTPAHPTPPAASATSFNPVLSDARCLIRLLEEERLGNRLRPVDLEQASTSGEPMPGSTWREWTLSYILISPLIACLPSFALFTLGILLLSWDTQPLPVSIFASAIVFNARLRQIIRERSSDIKGGRAWFVGATSTHIPEMADSSILPTSPSRKQARKRSSYAQPRVDLDDDDDFEEESGRASRARTKLIVEGFSNLALIATFFAGVQAQLLSDTNDDNLSTLAIATSAAFFGGLIFSVFTAILATLSGRWFSILREDDADYLSSRWLAQDSKLMRPEDVEKGSRHLGPDLREYLDYQIKSLQNIRLKKLGIKSRRGTLASPQITNAGSLIDGLPRVDSPEPSGTGGDEKVNPSSFDPLVFDLECILNLLQKERTGEAAKLSRSDYNYVPETREMARTTWKERALGWALLSPLVVCIPSFVLFTAGILFLAWDKQPRAVAIFTSATVLLCVFPLFFFFLEHRHKHVIQHIYLGRASL